LDCRLRRPGRRATISTELPAVRLDRATRARLRVWAAEVRDCLGEHGCASPATRDLARTLCAVLDVSGDIRAENAQQSADGSVALLLGLLVLQGTKPPT
jgi:hypothetical protein